MLFRAGVSGLTTALLLSRLQRYDITVVAKHMPGDYDIEYASPFAGANVIPSVPSLPLPPARIGVKEPTANAPVNSMSAKDRSTWERRTWGELKRLCEEVPEAGIHFQSMGRPVPS